MVSDDTKRLWFIKNLDGMSEGARAHLLSHESEAELRVLFNLAMANKFTDVAASIEVESDSRSVF